MRFHISLWQNEVVFLAIKSVSIRFEEEMLKKLDYVANYEGRSLNSHVLVLVRQDIKKFEETNGVITQEDIEASENVKPGGKKRQ